MAGQSDPHISLFSAEEIEFMAEDELIDTVPNMRMTPLNFIRGDFGQFLPQKALKLVGLATASQVVRGNEPDRQALLQFKAKITGDQLKIMESWNSSIDFCQWRGVTCGLRHQRVTKLELISLKLSGSLSPYIGNLSFLRELNLEGNGFYNQIPQEIGRLSRLETLEMTNNSLSGEIPSN